MYLIGYWHFDVVVYKTVKVIRTDYALETFQCTLYETILQGLPPQLQHRVLFLNSIVFISLQLLANNPVHTLFIRTTGRKITTEHNIYSFVC